MKNYPRIQKSIRFASIIFLISCTGIFAVDDNWFDLPAAVNHTELFKAINLLSLAVLLAPISFFGVNAKVFPGGGDATAPTYQSKKPFQFFLLIILWPLLSVLCLWGSWYWFGEYLNA